MKCRRVLTLPMAAFWLLLIPESASAQSSAIRGVREGQFRLHRRRGHRNPGNHRLGEPAHRDRRSGRRFRLFPRGTRQLQTLHRRFRLCPADPRKRGDRFTGRSGSAVPGPAGSCCVFLHGRNPLAARTRHRAVENRRKAAPAGRAPRLLRQLFAQRCTAHSRSEIPTRLENHLGSGFAHWHRHRRGSRTGTEPISRVRPGDRRAMRSTSEPSMPTQPVTSSLDASSCSRSFIKIRATSIKGPGPSARAPYTPSEPHSRPRRQRKMAVRLL